MAFKIHSNIKDFEARHARVLAALANPDKVIRTGCFNLFAEISERIQNQGRRTDGRAIEAAFVAGRSRTKRRGAYSAGWFYSRRKRGRQTRRMDLTDSGDLLDRGFQVGPVGRKSYGLGFQNKPMADRAEYLEDMFGPIFYASDKEKKDCLKHVIDDVRKIIKSH
jgi:hypothetical protein